MQIRNLTIPLYPYFPVGSVFPWEAPFRTEDIATVERNSARLFYISMGSETGTRLLGPGLASATAPKVQDISLELLINRPTTVLLISKGEAEAITPDDIEAAFERASELQQGDAILIATGWGDDARWKSLGEKFALESPFFSLEACEVLLSHMKRNKSELLLTDCAHLDRIGSKHARQEWAELPAWLRPAWPSDQAQAYLRRYTAEMARADWAVTLKLTSQLWVVAGLANCGQLPAKRVRLTCLPMFIQGAGEAPCTVMAELEEVSW